LSLVVSFVEDICKVSLVADFVSSFVAFSVMLLFSNVFVLSA
jgi:hypothetical protein